MTIKWYPCTDGTTQDCGGDTNTMVADETETTPAFSVWLSEDGELWDWAAWGDTAAIQRGWARTQTAAMDAAQAWLDALDAVSGARGRRPT